MHGHWTAYICCKMQTVFWEQSLRKTVSFEEQIMSTDKYKSTYFCAKFRLLCSLSFKYSATQVVKCLWMAYCLLCKMFSFECSLIQLNEQKNISLFLQQPQYTLSSWIKFQTKTYCRSENWGISLEWYPQISPSLSWGILVTCCVSQTKTYDGS